MDGRTLDRFIEAQAPVFDRVRAELRAGRKQTHWMWFIFPQMAGLGRSPMAIRFAISDLKQAGAYLDHPVLGDRLRECVRLVIAVEGRRLGQIFDSPDDLKFRSSMTLFEKAGPGEELFGQALDKYCDGERDERTLQLLGLGD